MIANRPPVTTWKQVLPLRQHHLHRGAANHKQWSVAGEVHEAPAGHAAPQRLCPRRSQCGRQRHSGASHRRWRRRQRRRCYRCGSPGLLQNVLGPFVFWSSERVEAVLSSIGTVPVRLRRHDSTSLTILAFNDQQQTHQKACLPPDCPYNVNRWGEGKERRRRRLRARHLRPRRLRRRRGGLDPRPQVPYRGRGLDDPAVVPAKPRPHLAAGGGLS